MKTKSKEILKVHSTKNEIKNLLVDYKCKMCGAIHEKKILVDVKSEKTVKICPSCVIGKLPKLKHSKILLLFTYENNKQKNYISSRLKYNDIMKIRKMLEAFLSKNNNYKLLLNENNTIGLKNPFIEKVWTDDLVIKTIEIDKVDRNRYFNPIERYEYHPTSRIEFKRICKSQKFNFDDFTEVDSGEPNIYKNSGGFIEYIKKYNYFFKKGTIEENYYKKGE